MSNNGPSNIRINPFTGDGGATTYVNLTETHIIPSTSPFIVRLNEVPEKQDPSNMRCVWVDSSTGNVTSNALTEVAATPSAGEFRPDYSTNADGNEAWNCGLIEFNSADAGKIVQISYTGMGTLAAVQSNKYPSWYTDRGDGSDGDFIPSEDTTISGVKNYKYVFIKEGLTLNIGLKTRIKCQQSFVNKGTISAEGEGAAGGASGGAGGAAIMLHTMQDSYSAIYYGSGGGSGGARVSQYSGAGGAGGGEIVIAAKTLMNEGKITANGENGGNGDTYTGGGGGGAGGRIMIVCEKIDGQGKITANGGNGGNGNVGANGSDGIVIIKELGVL